MLRSKASRWAAAPYLVWMVLFIVVPLGIVVWYALTNSDGQVTLANLTSIGRYASVFGRSLLLAAEATIICLVLAYPVGYFLGLWPPPQAAGCGQKPRRTRWGISSAGCAPINSILC